MKMYILAFVGLFGLLSAQDNIQYNIIVVQEGDSWNLNYEIKTLDKKFKAVDVWQSESQDSFLMKLIYDIHAMDQDSNEVLFYVHGMWGGTKVGFNKAYSLMTKNYLESEHTDMARIISLKWPGNDMEYKDNKARLVLLAPILGKQLIQFIRRFQFLQYINFGDIDSEMDLLAHSLGNELIKECLKDLPQTEWSYPLFDQMIFAAPDFDVDVYDQQSEMSALHRAGRRSHIYFSERDLTLEVSKNLNKKDRIGRCGPLECEIPDDKVFFVDVTLIKDDSNFPDLITGHSYYRSSPMVSADMLRVMKGEDTTIIPGRIIKESDNQVFILDPQLLVE